MTSVKRPRILPGAQRIARDLVNEAIASHQRGLAEALSDPETIAQGGLMSFVTTTKFMTEDDTGRSRTHFIRVITNGTTGETVVGTKKELPIASTKGSKGTLQ